MDHAPIATTTSTTPLLAPPPVIQIVSFSDVATSTPGRRRNSLAILFVSLLLILGLLSAGDGQEEYRSEQMINSSFDQSNHTLDQDRTPIGKLTSAGVVFSSWSESSVYVERTNSIHPSRPSAFGPHLTSDPLEGLLYPITAFTTSDSYGCAPSKTAQQQSNSNSTTPWIALVQRGHCSFSQKVRFAQEAGAVGVLFGDQSFSEGGIGGTGALLTPWSPDDTSDIVIPSAFVSRASYLSLLKTYSDEQLDGTALKGLAVVLSAEVMFTWPLLDFLIVLLFLPSLLTLFTVFVHRVRMFRQLKAERAPREAVAQLPVFVWHKAIEKSVAVATMTIEPGAVGSDAEERTVGLASEEERNERLEPTESTGLLSASSRSSRFSRISSTLGRFVPSFLQPTATSSDLAPRRQHIFLPNEECSICLSNWEEGDSVIELPCGHLFHEEEIRAWLLGSKRVCPMCRLSITLSSSDQPLVEVNDAASSEAAATTRSTAPAPVAATSAVTLDSHIV